MSMFRSAVALGAAACPVSAFACAACGCTLTADWLAQGLVVQPGTTLGLRYDYIPQTRLRTGTSAVDRGTIAFPVDREIEKYSYNHYLTASVDRQFANDWGVNLQVPLVYRPHATTDEGETGLSYSRTRGLGDVRLTGRWQGFETPGSINGLQFGLQLPTGRIHQRFRRGTAAGETVDRGLQPGTGTTQLVLGYYRYGKLGAAFDYVLQVQGQLPLYRRDAYRPGAYGEVSAGVHYTGWRAVTPQVQLDFRATGKDHGRNSDVENSGGEQLYLAPGLIAPLGGGLSSFVYAQVPLYQHVRGYQLTPRATLSVGVQYRL